VTLFVDRNLGVGIKPYLLDFGFEVFLHDDLFAQNGDDIEWIARASANDWPVLAADKGIFRNRLEKQAVIEAHLKFFCFASGHTDLQTHIEVVRKNLISIKALGVLMPGPFLASLTPQNLRFEWLGNPVGTDEYTRHEPTTKQNGNAHLGEKK